jgi:uncharacterized membrane protein (UPF0127 family)
MKDSRFMKVVLIFALCLLAVIIVASLPSFFKEGIEGWSSFSSSVTIHTKNDNIEVEIASTSEAREHGLSDRTSLAQDHGMLFIFPTSGSYAFWMKDMHFPLDIVWIDADKKVVGISSDISPSTYPNIFSPPSDILYVLELNAGQAQRYGLAVGKRIAF